MTDLPASDPGTLADRLHRVPLFSDLSPEETSRLAHATREKSYPKNSVILFEVKVVLIGEDGREVILSILRDGDFFGEMSLIDDQPRSAHVIATEDSNLLVLRRDDFRRSIEESPRIALGLLRALSRRLRRADDKIGSLALLDVNGRVARLLLELADEHDGSHIPRTVTHHMIAQMVGSSRETVSRTMRELADRGHVHVTRKAIILQDRPALKRLAGLS